MANLGKVDTTGRGFQIIEFQDYNGVVCSLQQSNCQFFQLPCAVWLGKGDERMHLSLRGVEALIADLQRWVDTGSFEGGTHEEDVSLLQEE